VCKDPSNTLSGDDVLVLDCKESFELQYLKSKEYWKNIAEFV
jgi:hypothetical protein